MCRQQRGVRTEGAVRYGCGPTRGEKESAERAAVSICWDGTEVPRGAFLQASVPCDRRGGTSSGRAGLRRVASSGRVHEYIFIKPIFFSAILKAAVSVFPSSRRLDDAARGRSGGAHEGLAYS